MNAWRAATCVLLTACSSAPVLAQGDPAYPSKALRVIVPFAAGGTTDTSARLVSRELTKSLGQSVIVENRPGAGGLVGTEAVLKLPADGYTLALATISTLAVLPTDARVTLTVTSAEFGYRPASPKEQRCFHGCIPLHAPCK